MAVNLHAAHKKTDSCAAHEALLLCRAWNIACVQYMKVDSHAAILCHTCFDLSHDKILRTHMCSPHTSANLDMSCTVYLKVNLLLHALAVCSHFKQLIHNKNLIPVIYTWKEQAVYNCPRSYIAADSHIAKNTYIIAM